MTHGLALTGHGINVATDPGQTVETTFIAGKPGTYWYYCTWFCSALHLEMRGRMVVKPQGAPLNENPNEQQQPATQDFAGSPGSFE
jgi:nitrous-oxide reductase